MNTLTTNNTLSLEGLPVGWEYVDSGRFRIDTTEPDDTLVDYIMLNVCGCVVQINRYDCDDSDVSVSIRRPDQFGLITSPRLHKSMVEEYIRKNT